LGGLGWRRRGWLRGWKTWKKEKNGARRRQGKGRAAQEAQRMGGDAGGEAAGRGGGRRRTEGREPWGLACGALARFDPPGAAQVAGRPGPWPAMPRRGADLFAPGADAGYAGRAARDRQASGAVNEQCTRVGVDGGLDGGLCRRRHVHQVGGQGAAGGADPDDLRAWRHAGLHRADPAARRAGVSPRDPVATDPDKGPGRGRGEAGLYLGESR